jgi:hypothetical protein
MSTAIGIFDIVFLAVGYVASIYTWPWIRTKIGGATAEYDRLRERADSIINAVKR